MPHLCLVNDEPQADIQSGAIILGLYEVVYKMILPEGQGGVDIPTTDRASYAPINQDSIDEEHMHETGPIPSGSTTPVGPLYPSPRQPTKSRIDNIPLSPKLTTSQAPLDRMVSRTPLLDSRPTSPHPHSVIETSLPPALHANFLTSCIGFATLVLMWPPLIILHWTEWEGFHWPGGIGVSSGTVWAGLGVVAWAGAFYVSYRVHPGGLLDLYRADLSRTPA